MGRGAPGHRRAPDPQGRRRPQAPHPRGGGLLVTDGPGYRADVDDEQLDLNRFSTLTGRARQELAAGDVAAAAEQLRAALALWRGPVMAGLGGDTVTAAATALDERRLAAAEQLFQLRLNEGEAAELVGDLRELIAEQPLRETLRGQLMLALYRSGRAAEALEEYGKVRDLLVEELGIDPGPRLVKLYEAILRDSDELAGPERAEATAPARPAATGTPPPAAQPSGGPLSTLPYDLTDFTGRDDELRRLLGFAEGDAEHGTRIVAVDGMGGSGKTSLAVRAAHLMADGYPDGRLFVDLRGYSPGEEPRRPSAVLASLLRTLGVPDQQIPEEEGGRAALWRATLSGRRVLLLLDNALDVAQVLPLLPASPGCLVLVTSRTRLIDLDGAEWISIGVLPAADSSSLLAETLGAQRMAAEPEAVAELAELCGHLPLALRIASARLRNRSRWTVQYLVDRLRDETRRLGELSSGERSVAATIQLSFQAMEEEARAAFRLLGLHLGADIDVHAAAALLGADLRAAEDLLEQLLDVHLAQQHVLGRYCLHDLVRSFAQSLRTEATATADGAAVERIVDYYVAASEEGCAVLFPGRVRHSVQLPATPAELPALSRPEQSRGWFDQESVALLAAVTLAHERGLDRHVGALARNVMFYLNLRSSIDDYERVALLAVDSARRQGEPRALEISLSNLTNAHWKLGRFQDGIAVAKEALEIARASGNTHGEAVCLDQLGLLHSSLGRLREARADLTRAVELLDNPASKAMALCNLSTVHAWLGQYDDAAAAAGEALRLGCADGAWLNEITALNDLAIARLGLGRPDQAATCLEKALRIGDESELPEELALAFALAADAAHRLQQTTSASAHEERALELVRARGTAVRRCQVENIIGRLRRHRGAYAQALELHESAARWAGEIDYRVELARAFDGMAQAAKALGDTSSATRSRERADALFAGMGVPDEAR
ncbi:AfsR/SARP family transcriptional regulator [Streptacidiphilus rugosus]|uniref:AfsR/SARP family transcriptional regulator n=1 Tax=Streptacidiphilus rugosus TaxID=405783 RepID=UPI000AB267F9|nr:BTAD domain-containing putative transcriptional regulator [Streptacidiphilus rugosus]